jgi:hypothetical protein
LTSKTKTLARIHDTFGIEFNPHLVFTEHLGLY